MGLATSYKGMNNPSKYHPRSSRKEVRIRVPFFPVVYLSRATLPQKVGREGHLAGAQGSVFDYPKVDLVPEMSLVGKSTTPGFKPAGEPSIQPQKRVKGHCWGTQKSMNNPPEYQPRSSSKEARISVPTFFCSLF